MDGGDFEDRIAKAVVIVKDQLDLLAKFFHKFDSSFYFNGTALQQLDCLNRAAEYVQLTDDMENCLMGLTKKFRSAYNLCCSSEAINGQERDRIHFYLAIKAIIHKLTSGDAPDIVR